MEASNQPLRYEGESVGNGRKVLKIILAIVVLAVIGCAVAWFINDRRSNDSATPATSTPTVTRVGPVVVSTSTLSALAANAGHTVYWAGSIPGLRPEFTKTTIARVYVRYLPAGVKAGDPKTKYLIVATYPFPGAYEALKKAAKGTEVSIPGGGIAVVSKVDPRSVNFAYPDADFQGEIYDPSAKKALGIATSGQIQPVP